jgi:hypothetical protein
VKTRSVVRLRRSPGGKDRFGDPIPSTVERTVIDGVLLAPRNDVDTGEPSAIGRSGIVAGLTLLRPGAPIDLRHDDQIEVDGVAFDVEGEVGDWRGVGPGGTQAALRRAEG